MDMGLPASAASLLPGLSQERPGVELLGPAGSLVVWIITASEQVRGVSHGGLACAAL